MVKIKRDINQQVFKIRPLFCQNIFLSHEFVNRVIESQLPLGLCKVFVLEHVCIPLRKNKKSLNLF